MSPPERRAQLRTAGALGVIALASVWLPGVPGQIALYPVLGAFPGLAAAFRRAHPSVSLSTRAGTPVTIFLGGTSRVTTAPAATTAPSPTVTPGKISAPAPM